MMSVRGLGVEASLPTQSPHKIETAARDFEAMMLSFLLHPLEKTMACIPGDNSDAEESQNYASLGTEALASVLAQGRGFGIAKMVLDRLHESTVPTVTEGGGTSAKVSEGLSR